jgi:hypothetical protein
LFNNDNSFYDTIINETRIDFEKNKLDSNEEIDNEGKKITCSSDEEEISQETEIDITFEEDTNDAEQRYRMQLCYYQRKSFMNKTLFLFVLEVKCCMINFSDTTMKLIYLSAY